MCSFVSFTAICTADGNNKDSSRLFFRFLSLVVLLFLLLLFILMSKTLMTVFDMHSQCLYETAVSNAICSDDKPTKDYLTQRH